MATVRISGKEEKIILAGTEELVASDGAADKNITVKTLLSDRLLTKSVAGLADVALTATEALYGQIVFTGDLTGDIDVTVPDATAKQFTVYNNTTGAYSLTFKTVTGTGVVLPQGFRNHVQADGTNLIFCGISTSANRFTGIQKLSKGADVASANALTVGTDGNYFDITGTTSIMSIATIAVGTVIKLHFDGILTLTHHSTDLILPGAANITTAAGDEAEFVEYAAGDWRCTNYSYFIGNASRGGNTFTGTQKWAKGADVASATALTVGTDGNYFDVTGTTTITSITTVGVGTVIKLHFDGSLILTHHGTDLVLPGGANITTAAGHEAEFVEYATGVWRCTCYTKADGTAIVSPPRVENIVTATTATTLTSTPTLLQITPAGYGVRVTLPDATTCTEGGPLHIIDNRGAYPVMVVNNSGTLLGFINGGVVSHISLRDNASAAGAWTVENSELVGASAQLLTTKLDSIQSVIALDSDRDFILGQDGADSTSYGVVYRKSTNAFGAVAQLRNAAVAANQTCILQATNQILHVSCDGTTGFEAVIHSINAGTDAITPNTAATATLSADISSFADGCGLIQVGTSFITSYTVATPAAQIREITVSGTTPTISAATVLGGTAGGLIVAGDSTHVIAVSTATANLYTKPYTIGGLAAGTGTTTAAGFTIGACKLTALGSRWAVIYPSNTGSGGTSGGIISLSSDTTTISTVSLVAANNGLADAIVVGSSKVLVLGNDSSGNANILTDSAGTASAGTAITLSGQTTRSCLYVDGTDVAVQEGATTYLAHIVDCSGASPVLAKTIAGNNANGMTNVQFPRFVASNSMLRRSANAVYGATFANTLTESVGVTTIVSQARVRGGRFSTVPVVSYSHIGRAHYLGTSASEAWCADQSTVITKIELATGGLA